jgi:hypothetical protein
MTNVPSQDDAGDAVTAAELTWRRLRARHVALLLMLFALAWALQLAWTSLTPPIDSLEQLIWVHQLQWGYYKHPPLPTWLLWLPVQLFGGSATTVATLGAVVSITALGVFWLLLRQLRGAPFATMALLAALCITYYNGRIDWYNHNVVLLLAVVCAAYACERAFATRRALWWVALGVAIGAGALTKYMMGLVVPCVAVVAIQQRAWRDRAAWRGLLLAAGVALALFAPHAAWLLGRADGPAQYAMQSSLGVGLGAAQRVRWSLQWLADQVLNRGLPAWLLLLAASVPWRTLAHAPRDAAAERARTLLLAWGMLPFVVITALGVTAGVDLQLQWGTPFLLFLVPSVMALFPRIAWSGVSPRRLATTFLALQLVLLGVSLLTSPSGPPRWRSAHWRGLDSQAIAEAVGPSARKALGGPVRVVIGPTGMAGALALRLPEQPLVLLDGNYGRSPWVPRDLVERCGAVELGHLGELPEAQPLGALAPEWAWRIIRPASAGLCAAAPR